MHEKFGFSHPIITDQPPHLDMVSSDKPGPVSQDPVDFTESL